MSKTAKQGDKVKVHYIGRLKGGDVFDSSQGSDPFEFVIGSGQVISGFENGIIGMSQGDKKTIIIAPEDAYGEVNENLFLKVPSNEVPDDLNPEVGMYLKLTNEQGDNLNVVVKEIGEETITLDANHPLAGQELTFDLDLVEIA